MTLPEVIEQSYREILSEVQETPRLQDVIDRTLFNMYDDYIEDVANFYLSTGCYGDYDRLLTLGLCREDLEVIGVNPEFDDFDVIHYLDLFKYTYIDKKLRIQNPAQNSLFGW